MTLQFTPAKSARGIKSYFGLTYRIGIYGWSQPNCSSPLSLFLLYSIGLLSLPTVSPSAACRIGCCVLIGASCTLPIYLSVLCSSSAECRLEFLIICFFPCSTQFAQSTCSCSRSPHSVWVSRSNQMKLYLPWIPRKNNISANPLFEPEEPLFICDGLSLSEFSPFGAHSKVADCCLPRSYCSCSTIAYYFLLFSSIFCWTTPVSFGCFQYMTITVYWVYEKFEYIF